MSQALLIPGRRTFRPPALGNLYAWYDASRIVASDGDRIGQWNDLSGNGRHVTQATAGKKPQYVASAMNGWPALRFDPARQDALTLSVTQSAEPATVMVVFRMPSTTPSANRYLIDGSATQRRGIYIGTDRRPGAIGALSGLVGSPYATGATMIAIVAFNGASSTMRVNGASGAATLGTGATPTAINIGNRPEGTQGFDGDIVEIAIWTRALSVQDHIKLDRYAAQRYAVELAVDGVYYVSSLTGADTNSGLYPDQPYLTLNAVKTAHGASSTPAVVHVTAPAATPIRGELLWDKAASITLQPAAGQDDWTIYGLTALTGSWTNAGGGVYSRTVTGLVSGALVYVPALADGAGRWLALTPNTGTPTAPAAGESGVSGTTLYVHLPGDADPALYTVEVAIAGTCVSARSTGEVRVLNGRGYGSIASPFRAGALGGDGKMVCADCEAWYAGTGGGFATFQDSSYLTATSCTATYGRNDGFNHAGNAGVASVMTLTDCEASYNGDEGVSPHDSTVLHVEGGRFHHNASSGFASVGSAVTTISGAEFDHNQTSGLDGLTGGVSAWETSRLTMSDSNVHDNPNEGILIQSTATYVDGGGNTSGTAAGNGLTDNLAA